MTDIEIQKQFELWNSAILSRDSQKVTALYDENAILLPTISNKVRHNHSEIEDYFRQFLSKGPKEKLMSRTPAYSAMLLLTLDFISFPSRMETL